MLVYTYMKASTPGGNALNVCSAQAAQPACSALEASLQEFTEANRTCAGDSWQMSKAIFSPDKVIGDFKIMLR